MYLNKLNLQMFAEGGAGTAGASAGPGGEAAGNDTGASEMVNKTRRGKGNPLSDVVYGKQPDQEGQSFIADDTQEDTSTPTKKKSQSFEELIKGDYKEEFDQRMQQVINKRFKETKGLQEQLSSYDPIMNMLAEKYGVDAKDPKALAKALEDDASFYEQEALEKGLTVEQLKENKRLQRENEQFRRAQEEAERRANSERIYSEWTKQAEELQAKYGLENFSLEEECQNPDFTKLLSHGISVESAYKAIHMDDMIGGAMAKTASTVREQMANSISSRQSRPPENGVSSTNSQVYKTDVNAWSKADREEVRRRVLRGETINL